MQFAIFEDPSTDVEKIGHAVQEVTALAPSELEYVPTVQFVHRVEDPAPTEFEYVPEIHLVHTVILVKFVYVPAVQVVQTLTRVTSEYRPTSHAVHGSGPVVFLYEPGSHGAQAQVDSVKSTPLIIASVTAEIASVLRNSSTTKTPAMSTLNPVFISG
jgi:hypothetical protein